MKSEPLIKEERETVIKVANKTLSAVETKPALSINLYDSCPNNTKDKNNNNDNNPPLIVRVKREPASPDYSTGTEPGESGLLTEVCAELVQQGSLSTNVQHKDVEGQMGNRVTPTSKEGIKS